MPEKAILSEEIRAIFYQETARGATPRARNYALWKARLEEERAAQIAQKQQQVLSRKMAK